MNNVTSEATTRLIEGTLSAVQTVFPVSIMVKNTEVLTTGMLQSEMGVLIGITGQVRGRLFIEAKQEVFAAVGELMFGMPLTGEMLESFVGELGNMIAGNMSTQVSTKGILIDITPPTVLVGQTKISGYDTALSIPAQIQDIGTLQIVLMVDETE